MGLTWQAPVTAPAAGAAGDRRRLAGDCADTSAPMATAVAQATPAHTRNATLDGRMPRPFYAHGELGDRSNSEQK